MWAYKQPRYLQAAGGQGARCAPREKFGEKFGERLKNRRSLVGVAGFEPATPSSRTRCATSHTPIRLCGPAYDCLPRAFAARFLIEIASSIAFAISSARRRSTLPIIA